MEEPKTLFGGRPYEKPQTTVVKMQQESQLIAYSEPNLRISIKGDIATEDADGAW